jgi:hypothetical protein
MERSEVGKAGIAARDSNPKDPPQDTDGGEQQNQQAQQASPGCLATAVSSADHMEACSQAPGAVTGANDQPAAATQAVECDRS